MKSQIVSVLFVCQCDDLLSCNILSGADWKSCPADFHCADFPKDVYFRAEVVADVVLPTDPQKFICVYLKPDTKYMEHLEKVLESQVERYMKMVQPSNFYPAINENVFILPRKSRSTF